MLIMDERDRERPHGSRGGRGDRGGDGPSRHSQNAQRDSQSFRGSRGSITSYFTQSSRRQGSSSAGSSRGSSQGPRRPAQRSSSSGRRSDRDRDPRHSYIDVPRAAYPPGQRDALKADAQETLRMLPQILKQLGTQLQAEEVESLDPFSLPAISPSQRPRHTQPATIRVVNSDTLNAAIELLRWPTLVPLAPGTPRPLIVNFASHAKPGGGWLSGALAQEEAICYRSSLYLSIHESRYPMGREAILYSPYVLVVRSDRASGHNQLTFSVAPPLLPVISAVSVAAMRSPPLRAVTEHAAAVHEDAMTDAALVQQRPARRERIVFAYETDRFETKLKMRMTLRAAASRGHDQLVLGALGCGVFANPPEEVARCWLEVLQEPEFQVVTPAADGSPEIRYWWKDVVFAIYDGQAGQGGRTDIGAQGGGSRSNFGIFHEVLHGQMV
ncbi:hypothetical protein F503_08359 [Ophiostoma piceae UAMH 11346]|uniref:Microbial-type PARG catalytic domain-containing protein n=1 Tax=Ophiostoma piceae (strain UAMH 11346) TaxID=1262450 RepID=S3CHL3_OPHP1|nr:hypothetical protein F503_08359 [Ophiostoma piceae UAMH 11346]